MLTINCSACKFLSLVSPQAVTTTGSLCYWQKTTVMGMYLLLKISVHWNLKCELGSAVLTEGPVHLRQFIHMVPAHPIIPVSEYTLLHVVNLGRQKSSAMWLVVCLNWIPYPKWCTLAIAMEMVSQTALQDINPIIYIVSDSSCIQRMV